MFRYGLTIDGVLAESESGDNLKRAEVLQLLVGIGIAFTREKMPTEAAAVRTVLDIMGFSDPEAESGEEDEPINRKLIL